MKTGTITGAIIGDTIGSIYEFNPTKDYNFEIMNSQMTYTDDSITTIAVADWILHDKTLSHSSLIKRLHEWCNKYPFPMGGYGSMFLYWILNKETQPYNSWGNGSAMRVSPIGFAFDTIEETLHVAQISAEITHNHPEGIKGAQATAAAIFLARNNSSKEEIRQYITNTFGYNLNYTCDDIRSKYSFEGSCQETVPQSLVAFLDSNSFEDAIRLTISLGGDADTMGAITGAVAAAYYKNIPHVLVDFTLNTIPHDLRKIIDKFETTYTL